MKVLREFQNSIHKDEPSFNPEGLEQWQKDNSGVFNLPAYELGHNFMEPLIDKFIRKMLKKELGEKKWWIDGVPKNIQTDCAAKRIQQGSEEPDQNFLNTIHYQKIVEDNWPLLGEYFTKPGSDNLKKSKKLDWFHKFNVIRQKYSHPQRENTTEAEYEFLKELHDWLKDKLVL